ncbi:MAG: mechanosensitive ion channel family protein [Anaerolineae bacterium]|nr:mechanosensitive ion channel family protein [Anaerolineae bacterium]
MNDIPIFSSLPVQVREAIVRILVLAVALLLIYLARRVLTWVLLTPLQRLMNRSGRQVNERLIKAVFGSVRLVLVAVALLVSAQILAVGDSFFFGLIQVMARSLLIIATLLLVYRLVDILAPTGIQLANLTGLTIDERLLPFLRAALKLFIIAVGLVIILQELGYDVSGLIAGIGIGGLAISLAAQDTIANLFGFASIVADRPFNVGDYIKTPDGEGTVERVGLRSTRLRQVDQTEITLPNNKVANSAISNLSRMNKRRIDIALAMTYDTTADQMRELLAKLRTLLDTWPTVERDSIQVFFNKFGESSLDVAVRCYIQKSSFIDLVNEQELIQLAVMDIVEALGLNLAFPSRSIYIENLNSEVAKQVGQKPTPLDDESRG